MGVFSKISKIAKGVKDSIEDVASDVIEDVSSNIEESKASITEKVNRIFHAGESGIFENVNDLTHEGPVEVTIYATYGYTSNGNWIIPMRGRVHQKRELPDRVVAELVAKIIGCNNPDLSNVISRSRDFTDDSRSGQTVTIEFDGDSDHQPFTFNKSDLNGLIEQDIELPTEKARRLLEAQGESQRLSFKVVSEGHSGAGQAKLIEPEGLSVVSDIDDTIKISIVPGDKNEVLKRTLCEDFQPVLDMAEMYKQNWSNAAFHYVSGGPWQLYRSLYEFLINGEPGFPEGSFHLNYYPKNFLAEDTREILIDAIVGSMGRTFNHKVEQISKLMQRFPGRKFILVGDSGEVDPEVYRHIKDKKEFREQVQEIWIRDVLDDDRVNEYRLDGMKVKKAEPVICATTDHYDKLSIRLQEVYDKPYARNTSPPCNP